MNLPDSEGEEEEEESEDDEEDMDLDDDDDSDSDDGFHYRGARSSAGIFKNVDLLYPRRIFTGARNHDTVKDCKQRMWSRTLTRRQLPRRLERQSVLGVG